MSTQSIKFLVITTFIYLITPFFIFIGGYLKWPLAVTLLLFLATLFLLTVRRIYKWELTFPLPSSVHWSRWVIAGGLLLIWILFSGMGAIFHQNGDYLKHNALLFDLVTKPWPVIFKMSRYGEDFVAIVYGLGFYWPAALLGKFTSLEMAHIALFIWGVIGVFLNLFLFYVNVGGHFFLSLFFLIFFSGMDFFGYGLYFNVLPYLGEHLEWWSHHWQYSSNTTLLYWTPQHFLPGHLLAQLLLLHFRSPLFPSFPFLLLLLGSLWSPFVVVGLIPFVLWATFKRIKDIYLDKLFYFLLPLGVPVLFYYFSHLPERERLFIWEDHLNIGDGIKFFVFILFEFGLYFFFLWKTVKEKSLDGLLLKISFTILVLLPLYKFGTFHDMMMRASIPSLLILQIYLAKEVFKKEWTTVPLIFFLFVGSITGGMEIERSLSKPWEKFPQVVSIIYTQSRFAVQYLGKGDSFFFNFLARKSEPHDTVPSAIRYQLGLD